METKSREDSKGKGVGNVAGGVSERPELGQRTSSMTSGAEEFDEHPLPDEHKAKIVEKYLVRQDTESETSSVQENEQDEDLATEFAQPNRSSIVDANASSLTQLPVDDEAYQGAHHMQGGAITDDLYRWAHQNKRPRRPRSESMHEINTSSIEAPVDRDLIKQPGGFRRSFVLNQAAEQGKAPPRALRSFVDFLMLYGHFAGEHLEDLESELTDVVEEFASEEGHTAGVAGHAPGEGTTEASQLLSYNVHGEIPAFRPRPRRKQGEASVLDAVLMLLKSFVGTGILFLGKAFFNGGILFSTLVLCAIAMISLWSFLLLVKVNLRYPVGFGDMGGLLYGSYMRTAILFSIVFSQLGFVAAYTVFIAENTQSFVLSMTECRTQLSIGFLIFLQCLIFLPLSLVRRIAKLSSAALVADVFILAGIFYLFYYEIDHLARDGMAKVVLFNRVDFPLLIGTAVFTFEGIGLVIPITDSMKEPQKFPRALTGVMIGIMVLFSASGVLSYAAFGPEIQTVVFSNLPRDSRFVQAIQIFYSLAILLSLPLQLFPALSILELGLFRRSGKYDMKIKMEKNFFRFLVVIFSMICAWVGADDLDKFVSLIGSVACVPLAFIYPPLLHLRGCARTRLEKAMDIALAAFGLGCAIFAGGQTLQMMLAPSGPKPEAMCIAPSLS
ncbi:hypothetical protein MPSI1_002701 [Malassezia psittaci]|uniref:Amino acid transporter transmembrane domain-containing protein n=1 Tax=Malassezia psittaci TaxID=1821823 RepID=A0AAF0FD51_9BASI|nr:hypothetical protein MPSI1_002701 [Malassezia psittaci]